MNDSSFQLTFHLRVVILGLLKQFPIAFLIEVEFCRQLLVIVRILYGESFAASCQSLRPMMSVHVVAFLWTLYQHQIHDDPRIF